MSDSNLTSRFPTIRWLFSWRCARLLLFGMACLVTLVALFYAEEDVRGKRAWNAYAREQAAKGEKLTVSDFIPPAVPDDQNLALCPLLKPLLDFRTVTNGTTVRVAGGQERWRDTNGLQRLQRLGRSQSVVEYQNQLPGEERRQLMEATKAAELLNRLEKPTLTNGWIDLAGWQAYYRTGTNLAGMETTNPAARDVLLALRHLEPDLAELQQEALRRPLARWPVFYETNNPWGILLPHLARVKSIGALLQLRSAARLAAGETEGGLADIELGFRLAESVREEPFLISHLVRHACHQLLFQPLKEGLARHEFSDGQIIELAKEFEAADLLAAYQRATRAERGCNGDLNRWAKESSKIDWEQLFGPGVQADEFALLGVYFRLAPSGWIYRSQLELFHLHDRFSLPAIDAQARRVYPEVAEASTAAVHQMSGPISLLPRFCFPDIPRCARRFALSQTLLNQAVIGCALERYRLAQGNYPETLEQLAPRFLAKVPTDLISGQPLKYERAGDGRYALTATGWDEREDAARDNRFGGLAGEKGDWVWRLPDRR